MKTHILRVSRTFPATHPRKAEETNFLGKIACGVFCPGECSDCNFKQPKIHTIRANYPLWEKRIKEVQEGRAVLSLRYWSGKPYNSKQIEFYKLDKDSEIGVQKLAFKENTFNCPYICNNRFSDRFILNISKLAQNDGLSLEDFEAWFKNYDLSKPMAIIHFTPFRY